MFIRRAVILEAVIRLVLAIASIAILLSPVRGQATEGERRHERQIEQLEAADLASSADRRALSERVTRLEMAFTDATKRLDAIQGMQEKMQWGIYIIAGQVIFAMGGVLLRWLEARAKRSI